MNILNSDALVFFGATGDLAYKKIFPSLQAMVKRGNLNVPVIGVAKAGWNLDQLKARAKDSLEKHGGLDPDASQKLFGLLRYVDGAYEDPATFQALRKELGTAQSPAHYLAIPPVLFGTVVEQLVKSGCAKGSRGVVEKPFGNDLDSARELNGILHGGFDESVVYRIDHYLGKKQVHNTESQAESVEMVFNRQLGGGDMDAYERVLTDAMAGDATLFARQDYVEEAWRIVDPALKAGTPVFEYDPQTWGPKEVERLTPPGGWQNPVKSS